MAQHLADAARRAGKPAQVVAIQSEGGTVRTTARAIEMAKAICRQCDVQAACLEFALATNQEAGVWGGTSEDERRRLRKQWLATRRRLKAEAAAAAS